MVWYSESARWILLRPTPTPAGDKPPRYRIPAVRRNYEARRGNRDPRVRWAQSIPDRSPGHAFVPIAHAGCRRHTQGMKMRPGRWKGLGLFGATPPLWIPAPYRGTGHASDRRNDKFARVPPTRTHDGKRLFSYQSLMPVGAGTPKYEKPELWLGPANWHDGFCHAPPRPQRGTSPRATFSHSAIDHRSTVRHVSPAESRDGGRIFVPMTGPPVGIRHCGHNRSRLSQIRARDVLSQCCCTEALQGKGARRQDEGRRATTGPFAL